MLTQSLGKWKYGWVSLLHFHIVKATRMVTYCIYKQYGQPTGTLWWRPLKGTEKTLHCNPSTAAPLSTLPTFLPAVDTTYLSRTTSHSHPWCTDPDVTRSLLEIVFPTSVSQFSLSMPYICDAEYIHKVCYPNTEDYSRNFEQNI